MNLVVLKGDVFMQSKFVLILLMNLLALKGVVFCNKFYHRQITSFPISIVYPIVIKFRLILVPSPLTDEGARKLGLGVAGTCGGISAGGIGGIA